MTKDSDRLERLENELKDAKIRQGIADGIRIRCITFWSGIIGLSGFIGSWCANHIDAIKAGFIAFWEVLWTK